MSNYDYAKKRNIKFKVNHEQWIIMDIKQSGLAFE